MDSSTGRGAGLCTDGTPNQCEPTGDSADLALTSNTTVTLVAINDFGQASAAVQVHIQGSPSIDNLTIGGNDALATGLAIANADAATLAWTTTDAVSTILESSPPPSGGCADPSAAFAVVQGQGGAANGTFDISLTQSRQCLRLTAVGSAGLQASAVVEVVRAPLITAVTTTRDTVARGDAIGLSVQTSFAESVAIAVSPLGAVAASDLQGCGIPDGGGLAACTVAIQPGTPLGDVTFTAVANGAESTVFGQRDAHHHGWHRAHTAELLVCACSPHGSGRCDARVAVVRRCHHRHHTDDQGAAAFSSNAVATVQSGSSVLHGVARTTTWTAT